MARRPARQSIDSDPAIKLDLAAPKPRPTRATPFHVVASINSPVVEAELELFAVARITATATGRDSPRPRRRSSPQTPPPPPSFADRHRNNDDASSRRTTIAPGPLSTTVALVTTHRCHAALLRDLVPAAHVRVARPNHGRDVYISFRPSWVSVLICM